MPGCIVVLTTALLLAPVVPLASPAAAASQPVVSSVSPGSGTIGTPVTITGSGFGLRLYRRTIGPGLLRRDAEGQRLR